MQKGEHVDPSRGVRIGSDEYGALQAAYFFNAPCSLDGDISAEVERVSALLSFAAHFLARESSGRLMGIASRVVSNICFESFTTTAVRFVREL